MFESLRHAGFDIRTRNHAEAILAVDFPQETAELVDALLPLAIPVNELIASGGGEAKSTQRLRQTLSQFGWRKHNFRIETTVDGISLGGGTSHEIDHIRRGDGGTLALEIEWNNKDPFFDRDLENFQRLHAQSIISAGIVITRGAAMQEALATCIEQFLLENSVSSEEQLLSMGMKERTSRQKDNVRKMIETGQSFARSFARTFVSDKFGMASTHWSKLEERINRGVGNPCPLLLIGLPSSVIQIQTPETILPLFGGDT